MHRGIGACVALGTAMLGIGCSQPLAEGPPENLEMGIFGGTPTTDWDSVVFLHSEGGMCTGVVVESEVVLTAAHCLEGIWGTVEVYWGDDLAQGNWEYYGFSDEYYMHPYYDPNTLTGDIGALRLSEPSPTDPIPINCDPPSFSWLDPHDPVTGVGFGMVYPDPGSGGVKMEAPIAFESWDSSFLFHADPDHGFCRGDGGAPVLTDHGGDWAVAAVSSHGVVECVGFGAATRTDPHVDWLEGLFPGWDVCGGGDDDDTTGDDDDTTGDDDDTTGDDDDTTGDDDTEEDDEGELPQDCACRGGGGAGGGGVVLALAAVFTRSRRRSDPDPPRLS